MIRKIGRFDAYVPDRDVFDTILGILQLRKGDKVFEAPLHRMHHFFYAQKGKYPDLFEDVYFNNDPEFPFSKQIADAFIRLQESGFITRPNPSLNEYKIDVDFEEIKIKGLDNELKQLEEIAESFDSEFRKDNNDICRAAV